MKKEHFTEFFKGILKHNTAVHNASLKTKARRKRQSEDGYTMVIPTFKILKELRKLQKNT